MQTVVDCWLTETVESATVDKGALLNLNLSEVGSRGWWDGKTLERGDKYMDFPAHGVLGVCHGDMARRGTLPSELPLRSQWPQDESAASVSGTLWPQSAAPMGTAHGPRPHVPMPLPLGSPEEGRVCVWETCP